MNSKQAFLDDFFSLRDRIYERLDPVGILDFFRTGFKLTGDDRFRRFQLDYSPWIATLCDWFDDPGTDWIYLVQGSQTSKTTFLMGALLYVSQHVSGAVPALWVQSTEDEAKLFIGERLKAFLDEAGRTNSKEHRWKQSAFRIFNASVKVGFATTRASLRSKPARFVFGDECGIWKEPISYVKKRTRTFIGKRKGLFATTPPEFGSHHSWIEATAGNFYQWWVICPDCGARQGLKFSNLKWYKRKNDDEEWDFDKVKDSVRYRCEHCGALWKESQKAKILQTGKAVAVDPDGYREVKEKVSDSKTLQVSALYSVFTSWGQLAVDFLVAKASGPAALMIFFTDELAEVPKSAGESMKEHELDKYKAPNRKSGVYDGYDLVTAGVDVQRLGTLYYVSVGWRRGALISGHVIEYGKCPWKDSKGNPKWDNILEVFAPAQRLLYRVALDATDGVEQQNIYDFCFWAGHPFVPLIDRGVNQAYKIKDKPIEVSLKSGRRRGQMKVYTINSAMFKNDIHAAFQREPCEAGAWSFPAETEKDFLRHLSNEHRVQKRHGGKSVTGWEPRYAGAPQHWFSALVYAAAAMEDQRFKLQTTKAQQDSGAGQRRYRRVKSRANIWR